MPTIGKLCILYARWSIGGLNVAWVQPKYLTKIPQYLCTSLSAPCIPPPPQTKALCEGYPNMFLRKQLGSFCDSVVLFVCGLAQGGPSQYPKTNCSPSSPLN